MEPLRDLMKVLISDAAERDLEAIGDYIARDDPARALRFLIELRDLCLGLGEFPARYPIVPRYEVLGVRRRVHGRYAVFYVVGDEAVTVLHVLHGARDHEAIL